MNSETARYLARAKELRELAATIKSEYHRKLLIERAEKFEKMAQQAGDPERKQ